MALHRPLQSLSDDQLLSGLADVAGQSRRAESTLVDNICLMCPPHNRHLAEIDYGTKLMSRYLDRRE
jgi:hypothetical protein